VTEDLKAVFTKENTNLVLIAHRLTSVLKPLVFLNERKSWMEWMADSIHYLTVIGSQKNPSEQLIFSWITVSLTDIYEEMIKSSFFWCIQNLIFLC